MSNIKTIDIYNSIDRGKMFTNFSKEKKCSKLENSMFHSIGHFSRIKVIFLNSLRMSIFY